MTKKASLKDIANKVGVSTALVSYVLNGLEKEKRVGPEIVKKIHEAARELKYKPNQIARSLRVGSTSTIGLVVADISNPFFAQLARIIEDEAGKYNYTVIFGSSDENFSKSATLIDSLLHRQVDGFIIAPAEGGSEHIRSLLQMKIPVVLIDRYLPGISANHVVLDNYQATYSAVNCLISKGYRNINLIAYRSCLIHMQERIRGYKEAMKANGMKKANGVKEVSHNHMKKEMESLMTELLTNGKTDALLFATNALSISGLYAIQQKGVKVPEELGVIGFDGHEVFDFFHPQLTYILQPLEAMGKEAVRILTEQIKGAKKTERIELQHRLIERASCR